MNAPAVLKQKFLLRKTNKLTTNNDDDKTPNCGFLGETTSFLTISIWVLTSGSSSAPLSARRGSGRAAPSLPPHPHNAGSLPRRCRQAAAEAEGKTEGPHSSRANNCPQCTNKTAALEARGRPKGQVPCARSGQPGTPRGCGARAQLRGEAEPPEEPPARSHPAWANKTTPERG